MQSLIFLEIETFCPEVYFLSQLRINRQTVAGCGPKFRIHLPQCEFNIAVKQVAVRHFGF